MDELVPAGSLEQVDPLIHDMIRYEAERQNRKLIMIASESICPPAVRAALSSEFGHIYAEGYPSPRTLLEPAERLSSFSYQLAYYRRLGNRRYYKGCEYVDLLEQTARRRTAEVFASDLEPAENIFVNVQSLSGAAANNAVYNAFVEPGDTVMGPSLTHGGHLTHGSEVNRSGMNFNVVPYEIARSGKLDYDEIEKLAVEHEPKLIIGGFSAYPWDIDWARMRGIADRVGAVLLADIAHLAGLVAAGLLNNPVGHAHVTSFTTHKTLCGPRGAMLLSTDPDIAAKVDMGVFPGEQGGPHIHVLAAKAVAMKIAASEEFRNLQRNVQQNAAALAEGFSEKGLSLAYGGTNTHMCLIDLRKIKTPSGMPLTGEIASRLLDLCGITCNKNTIFGDTNANHPSGLRFGTTWVTQRGLDTVHMKSLAGLVARVLTNIHPFGYIGGQTEWGRGKKSRELLEEVAVEVTALLSEADPEPTWDPDTAPSGYPHFPPPASSGVRETPLASLHKSQAVKMVEKDGYHIPASYGDPHREQVALTEGVALVDSGGELLVEVGQGRAGQLLECACTSRVLALDPGQGCPSLLLDQDGRTIARAMVLRLRPDEQGSDRFWLKMRTAEADRVLGWLRGLSDGYLLHDQDLWLKAEGPAVIENLAEPSDGRDPVTCLGLRGPNASDVIEPVFDVDSPAMGESVETDGCVIFRRPEGIDPGFELFIPVARAFAIWSRLVEAGARPAGYEALVAVFEESGQDKDRPDDRIDLSKPFFIGLKALLKEADSTEEPPAFEWRPDKRPLEQTCLFAEHEKLCKPKHLVPFAGWKMPVMYSGILDEHEAVRTRAGLFDVSHMGLLEFSGPFTERFLDLVTTNYVPTLLPGQAHYSYLLAHDGRCIDDVIVYRLARERFLMVVNAANADEDEAWLRAVADGEVLLDPANPRARAAGEVRIRNLKNPDCGPDSLVDLAFQGPEAARIMAKLSESRTFILGIERLRKFELASGKLAGIDVVIARTGYTGEEIGFEIFVHPEKAPELWNTLLEAGRTHGLVPVGLGARDSLRTEAGFPLHGHELAGPHRVTPLESGYGSYVKLHKPFFTGRAAMLEGHKNRERTVIRFEVDEKGGKVLRSGNPVLAGRKNEYAGVVTSSTATGSRQVGLALVESRFAREGNKVHVLPITETDKPPRPCSPLEMTPGDWITVPRQATILPRFMAPGEQPLS